MKTLNTRLFLLVAICLIPTFVASTSTPPASTTAPTPTTTSTPSSSSTHGHEEIWKQFAKIERQQDMQYSLLNETFFAIENLKKENSHFKGKLLGLTRNHLENAVTISTTGPGAIWGEAFGLYVKDESEAGLYKQMGSKARYMYRGYDSWYVVGKSGNEEIDVLRSNPGNDSESITALRWEYNGGYGFLTDNSIKVEKFKGSSICTSVKISGPGVQLGDAGIYNIIWGQYSFGRPVYVSGEGKYLRIKDGHFSWHVCAERHCSSYSLVTTGANSMSPADPVAANGGSWGYEENGPLLSSALEVECLDEIKA